MGCILGSDPSTCASAKVFNKCMGCPAHTRSMVEGGSPTWFEQYVSVDGRVYTHPATICSFAGNEKNDDRRVRCKHFTPSSQDTLVCMYYKSELGWCDCINK